MSRHFIRCVGLVSIVGLLMLGILVAGIPQGRAASSIQGLHVSGNQILNGSGQAIHLYGVDRSGAEYACEQGWGIWDGPADATSVAAIASWNANIVRIPVNEDCWLGINGVAIAYAGANYQQAIVAYVNLLNSNGIAAIIDLQLNAPGTILASSLNPMPDEDHSPVFWQSVATTFSGNSSVLFDLLNEPYPDNNNDSTAAWTCWKNGGMCSGVSYQAAGMQELVTKIRATGATNIIMLGGLQYSNTLTQWLTYKPSDPTGNLVAAWHIYDFAPACNTTPYSTCWDSVVAPVMTQVPLIAGEIGETDCNHVFIDPLMAWLDSHGGNYLGWTWDAWAGACSSGPTLITDYSGTPTNFGIGLKDHLASLAGNTPTPSATPSVTSTATFTSTVKPTNTPTTLPTATLSATPKPTNTPTSTFTPTSTLPPTPTFLPGT